jgi:branched-chain amino acid aminotransferase
MANETIFYVNGSFVPRSEAKISVCDLGLMRGYAAFEALRTYQRILFHPKEHIERLEKTLDFLRIPKPQGVELILNQLIEKNPESELAFRIIVSAGENEDSVYYPESPSLIIHTLKISTINAEYYLNGIFVITTKLERIFPEFKTTSYLAASLALQEAKAQGAREALYVSKEGHLLELTRGNLFAIKDGVLITPKKGILEGITKKVVLKIASDLFIPVEERPILESEIETLDEAFQSSSIKELVPIVKIDDKMIGDGKIGPLTKRLIEQFHIYTSTLLSSQTEIKSFNCFASIGKS